MWKKYGTDKRLFSVSNPEGLPSTGSGIVSCLSIKTWDSKWSQAVYKVLSTLLAIINGDSLVSVFLDQNSWEKFPRSDILTRWVQAILPHFITGPQRDIHVSKIKFMHFCFHQRPQVFDKLLLLSLVLWECQTLLCRLKLDNMKDRLSINSIYWNVCIHRKKWWIIYSRRFYFPRITVSEKKISNCFWNMKQLR